MFVRPDFQTKRELRDAVGRGEVVTVWSDVPLLCPVGGELISVRGPKSLRLCSGLVWTARVLWKHGKIVKVN